MEPSLQTQVLVIGVFVLAGLVKGTIGMGLPTVAMGLLGLLLAPAQAAALLVVPSLVTNVWQMASGPCLRGLLRRLWPLLLAAVAGTLAAIGALAGGDARTATTALGAALLAYGAFGIAAPQLRVPRRWERWLAAPVGLATGLVTGATGVFVMPAVPYLQALGMARDELVQALGLCFTVSTVALALALWWSGALGAGGAALSGLAVVPAVAGVLVGQRIRRRLGPAAFKALFFWGLVLLGGQLAAKGWS